MTKGGARQVSAKRAVAKGMGISIFFEVLVAISNHPNGTTVDEVMDDLYHLFGGTRNETCRSYFKELWRHGLIDKLKNEQVIECTSENWSRGGKATYKINNNGLKLLSLAPPLRPSALAWLLVQLDGPESFEQLHRTFNVLKTRNLPLNYFKASEITGVVRDSIKAIMYGWLEPLGFLERVDSGKNFKLNEKYYNKLKSFQRFEDLVPLDLSHIIEVAGLQIQTVSELPAIAPGFTSTIDIPFRLKNDSEQDVEVELKLTLYDLFDTKVLEKEKTIKISLAKKQIKEIIVSPKLKQNKTSESFSPARLGVFEAGAQGKSQKGALPTVYLTSKGNLNEINLFLMLKELGYKPILFTKSDRPDMVLFPTRKELNLKRFLQNDEFKILVETTGVDVLTLAKVLKDLKNFKRHTTKVLKINAKRTLIVGHDLASNLTKEIPPLLKKFHPFTIITFEDLEYLTKKSKLANNNSWGHVGKVLCSAGIVSRQEIDTVFK